MISAVAFVPQAPLLAPALTGGSSADLDELRTTCGAAIAAIAAPDRQLILVGAGEKNAGHASNARGTLAGFGAPVEVGLGSDDPGPTQLPPSLTIGAWLLRDALGPNNGAIGYSVDPQSPNLHLDGRGEGGDDVGLIVLGDGAATRTLKAPRYLDDRAAGYDETVAAALRSGNAARLGHAVADPILASELSVAGAPVWRAVAAILGGNWQAELRYDAAPFGVGYFVATWIAQ